jgi:hypothetical protein
MVIVANVPHADSGDLLIGQRFASRIHVMLIIMVLAAEKLCDSAPHRVLVCDSTDPKT